MRSTLAQTLGGIAFIATFASAQNCGCFTATQSVVPDDCAVAGCHVWSTTTVPMADRNCPRTSTITATGSCPTGTDCDVYWMTSFYSTSTCVGGSGSNPTSNPRPTATTTTTSIPRPPTTMTTQPAPPRTTTTSTTTSTRGGRPPQTTDPAESNNDTCPTATFTFTETPRKCATPDCIRFATMTVPSPKKGCGRMSSTTVTTKVGSCPECTTVMQTVTAGGSGGREGGGATFGNGGGITISIG